MQISKWILVVTFVAGACVGACKSDDEGGGAGASAGGGAGGTTGGAGGTTGGAGGTTGGAGGATAGAGGAAGAMTGGMGGMSGAGGMAGGGAGGMTGGMGGMTGGAGGMTGGMGGMTGGMGGDTPDSGEPDSSMTGGATFTDVYAIIEMRCGGGGSGCHVMGSSGGLNMQSKMMAFQNLVGVDSEECNDEVRVIAGDADNSLLIQALEGSADCIDPMPRGRAPLPEADIATIREWIEAGAMND
jgi:hypothetical protein